MKFNRFLPGISWLVLVTVLLCLPGSTLPKSAFLEAIYADKWVHVFLFGTLVLLFALPFRPGNMQKTNRWLFVIVLCGICYGIAMEFVQDNWIPNRSFELADIGADSVGALLGSWVFRRLGAGGKKIGPDRNRDRNQN